ncbi:hypothetical protein GCM10009092_24900 [Bowmanella denitrificans]|uniref:DUF4760 domain-containing protein n=1 Tax=Bowmanella denitrificans TaxID=366582 RepID=A0ABP3H460_9ALTE
MDRTVITISILILLSAIISAVGVQFGDQIEASVPGGKATGLVAGVAILVGLFVAAYKSVLNVEKNVLDKEGLKYILELHFGSVSHQLMHVINDFIVEMESSSDSLNSDVFVINCKRVIDNSRNKLSLFTAPGISNIPQYLDELLSHELLEEHIKKGLEIIQRSESAENRKKLAYQLIQSIQSDLWKKLKK